MRQLISATKSYAHVSFRVPKYAVKGNHRRPFVSYIPHESVSLTQLYDWTIESDVIEICRCNRESLSNLSVGESDREA